MGPHTTPTPAEFKPVPKLEKEGREGRRQRKKAKEKKEKSAEHGQDQHGLFGRFLPVAGLCRRCRRSTSTREAHTLTHTHTNRRAYTHSHTYVHTYITYARLNNNPGFTVGEGGGPRTPWLMHDDGQDDQSMCVLCATVRRELRSVANKCQPLDCLFPNQIKTGPHRS